MRVEHQLKAYQLAWQEWLQKCQHILNVYESQVRVWIQRCQNTVTQRQREGEAAQRKASELLEAARALAAQEWKAK